MYGDPSSEPEADARGTREMPFYSRDWRFDPYHQGLRHARRADPGPQASDTEWAEWEVFQQVARGEHHHHVGTLHAPDAETALVLSKENFARRGACVNLWVVRAADVHATAYEDEDMFAHTTDKTYREPAGFQGLRQAKIHGAAAAERSGRRSPAEDEA